MNPLPPLNSLVRRLAGFSDDQSLPCSIMMKNVGENVCCLLFPRRMRTESSEKFQGSNTPFPLLYCGLKRIVHCYKKFSTMNNESVQTNTNISFILYQKIISMKQYIISLFMRKVFWYLFLLSPGLILVQSSLLFSTLF